MSSYVRSFTTNTQSRFRNNVTGQNGVFVTSEKNSELVLKYYSKLSNIITAINTLLIKFSQEDLKSAFNLTKACLKVFLKNKAGSIINMTSIVGITGNAGQANYAASKAGLSLILKSRRNQTIDLLAIALSCLCGDK